MKVRGSVTVEMSFLVPIIFSVIVVVIQILFYFHDKIILEGVVYETVMVCSGKDEITEEDVNEYFSEALGKRLLMFANIESEVMLEEKEIKMSCSSWRNNMEVHVSASMKRTNPVSIIRAARLVKGELM